MSRFSKDDLVSDDYLCNLLGVGKSAAAAMRRTGRGPVWHRLNGRPYYTVSDIDAWIESNRVNPTAA
jgi:hypothetical protein